MKRGREGNVRRGKKDGKPDWRKRRKRIERVREKEKENVKREKHETRISLSITYALNPGIYTSGINTLGLPPSASSRLHWYCVSWTEATTQVLSRYNVVVRVSMSVCITPRINVSNQRNDLLWCIVRIMNYEYWKIEYQVFRKILRKM